MIDLKAIGQESNRGPMSESQLDDRKRIIKKNNLSEKQKRKQEKKELRNEERLKKDSAIKKRGGIRRKLDERVVEPDFGDFRIKM